MDDRRLVGIDLGIISAHTVRVLAGDGSLVCRCKAIPTVDSLERVERAAGRLLHLLLNDQFGARVLGSSSRPDPREAVDAAKVRLSAGWVDLDLTRSG
jgi:hypothetical protein